jgi:general secretion pathway protein K
MPIHFHNHSERGSATIIALIVVSLVAICVTSVFWKQNLELRKLSIYKENSQISWLERSLIDVVRLVLKIDVQNNPAIDHLGEIWALPLEDSKIEDYLKTQDLPEELKNVRFSGSIQDAQGMFNLANLWDQNMTNINLNGLQTYSNLLQELSIDKSLADLTANQVLKGNFKPQYIEDLINVPGYSLAIIKKLSRFVILLPEPTTTNINTTSTEVFLAIFPTFTSSEADNLMLHRANSPLKSLDDVNQLFTKLQTNKTTPINSQIDVKSNYWIANTAMSIDQRNIRFQTLIKRSFTPQADKNFTTVLWSKQKITQIQ